MGILVILVIIIMLSEHKLNSKHVITLFNL